MQAKGMLRGLFSKRKLSSSKSHRRPFLSLIFQGCTSCSGLTIANQQDALLRAEYSSYNCVFPPGFPKRLLGVLTNQTSLPDQLASIPSRRQVDPTPMRKLRTFRLIFHITIHCPNVRQRVCFSESHLVAAANDWRTT